MLVQQTVPHTQGNLPGSATVALATAVGSTTAAPARALTSAPAAGVAAPVFATSAVLARAFNGMAETSEEATSA